MDNNRRTRIRRLVRRLNQERKKQARQIDILCNDMVEVHRHFAVQLHDLIFTTEFYESLLGSRDLPHLLEAVADRIQREVAGAHVSVYLLHNEGFVLHRVSDSEPIDVEADQIEAHFPLEVARQVCRANWICSMDDLYKMGLMDGLEHWNSLSVAAIPLGRYSPGLGFVLLCRRVEQPISRRELQRLGGVVPGLSRAIAGLIRQTEHAGGA